MRYFICTVAMLFALAKGIAQTKNHIGFSSYNAVGFVAGNSPVAFTAQTVNGVSYGKWFAGAGFGLDQYHIKTLPLFVDVKRTFILNRITLFLFADAGTHFAERDKKINTAFASFTTKGGLYLDAGLGCKLPTGRTGHIFFSLGNTLKKITQTETSLDTGFPYKNEIFNTLSRISFKMGYQF
jgi:hypothetical protein